MSPLIKILTLSLISLSSCFAQWPVNLSQLSKSICVVEFFQPKRESMDIEDKSRFKRHLTGILVSDDGLVITSDDIYPVNLDITSATLFGSSMLSLPEDITVSFKKEKKMKARFLGKDEENNLGFIRIENPANLPTSIAFDTSSTYAIGDRVYLIEKLHSGYDFETIITERKLNSIMKQPKSKLIINTSLRSLSPGGLVVNDSGLPIGIVQKGRSIYNQNPFEFDLDRPLNSAMLIEVLTARYFMDLVLNPPQLTELKKGGGKSWLGIQMQILTRDMANYWQLKNTSGIIINQTLPDSPAEKAGLQVGDIITSIAGLQVKGNDQQTLDVFRQYVRNLPEGEVEVQYLRDKKKEVCRIELISTPKSQFLADEYSISELGLGVKEITRDIILNYNLDFDTEGVWVSRIEVAGIANLSGLFVNDIILKINDNKIKNIDDFRKSIANILRDKPAYLSFFILRNNKTQFLFLKTRWDENTEPEN